MPTLCFEAEGNRVRTHFFESHCSGDRVLDKGCYVFLDELGVVGVHIVMKRVEMHPAIVPVLVCIKVVPPDLDELHHTRQVYVLKQEEYVFAARGLRQALCNLMYLLLRHCVVDLPKMVLAHRN